MGPNQLNIQRFFYKLSLGAAISVLLFSILNGYGFIYIIIRTALAFIVIYYLGQGLLVVWQSISPSPHQAGQYSSQYFEAVVGEEIELKSIEKATLSTEKRPEDFPGQIRMNIKDDLQEDANTKAELVRRMGWEDSKE